MLLNFKKQFVPFVLDGSKAHTIRGLRKDGKVAKVGETCHLYTGLRQRGPIIQKLASGDVAREKMAKLLGRFPCVKVEEICILPTCNLISGERELPLECIRVVIDHERLSVDELDALAHRDGFREGGFAQMMQFWQGRLPFAGHIIHWDFSRPVGSPEAAKKLARMLATTRAITEASHA